MASFSASALSVVGDLAEFLLFFCCLRLNGTRGDESFDLGDDESVEVMADESVELMEDSETNSKTSFSPSESEEERRASLNVLRVLSLLFAVVMVVL